MYIILEHVFIVVPLINKLQYGCRWGDNLHHQMSISICNEDCPGWVCGIICQQFFQWTCFTIIPIIYQQFNRIPR